MDIFIIFPPPRTSRSLRRSFCRSLSSLLQVLPVFGPTANNISLRGSRIAATVRSFCGNNFVKLTSWFTFLSSHVVCHKRWHIALVEKELSHNFRVLTTSATFASGAWRINAEHAHNLLLLRRLLSLTKCENWNRFRLCLVWSYHAGGGGCSGERRKFQY